MGGTPEHLLSAGVYRSIATQLHGGEYEAVCVRQLLKALGMQNASGARAPASRRALSVRRLVSSRVSVKRLFGSMTGAGGGTGAGRLLSVRSRPKCSLSSKDVAGGESGDAEQGANITDGGWLTGREAESDGAAHGNRRLDHWSSERLQAAGESLSEAPGARGEGVELVVHHDVRHSDVGHGGSCGGKEDHAPAVAP